MPIALLPSLKDALKAVLADLQQAHPQIKKSLWAPNGLWRRSLEEYLATGCQTAPPDWKATMDQWLVSDPSRQGAAPAIRRAKRFFFP